MDSRNSSVEVPNRGKTNRGVLKRLYCASNYRRGARRLGKCEYQAQFPVLTNPASRDRKAITRLQPLCRDALGSVELRERAVNRTHRRMPCGACDLEHQTIGKSQRRPDAKVDQSRDDTSRSWIIRSRCLSRKSTVSARVLGLRRRADAFHFVARWLAYLYPCRRFDCILAGTAARLGADVDRYPLHRSGLSPPTPRRFYPGAP